MFQPKGIFKLTGLAVVIFYLLFSSIQAIDVTYCDKKGNYKVKVHGVEIIPDPVVTGQPATFKVSAFSAQAIPGGKVVIDVSYFGVHVHQEDHDLCEELSCPVAEGDFVLSHTQTLPGFTPPGSYKLKMTVEDKNNKMLSCFSFNFKISFGSLASDS
ncbi:putative phosphatidylglycerol/phosphatidylinositol transfer protein DDB_G0282179 [Mangifera indica]|uniref:putative phosphatidylglycerol/phosphatidylinositol transfer protein DDB_G0282179 n=1 Tax=Mangifera indica TaxID=29780 RepID=UPI001CF972C6|nr:putative phosphatidylglycerol/phosphatidylinositol transfer protein DDB_G0282179 [Mangifera indica]